MMKPQVMSEVTFFNLLCRELDLDPMVCDEDNIIAAIKELKQELAATDKALSIVQTQVENLIDDLENPPY